MCQITMGNTYESNYYGQYIGFKLLWEIHESILLWVIHAIQVTIGYIWFKLLW